MARVITKEYHVDCNHCSSYIAYTKDDVKEIVTDGFREPAWYSYITCPACFKKITLKGS